MKIENFEKVNEICSEIGGNKCILSCLALEPYSDFYITDSAMRIKILIPINLRSATITAIANWYKAELARLGDELEEL